MAETKLCRRCGIEKPVSEFYRKRVLASGLVLYRPDCRTCAAEVLAADEYKTEMARQRAEDWRARDIDKARKSCRDSRKRHIEERRATQAKKRADPLTRQSVLDAAKQNRIKHHAKILAGAKAHRSANSEHYRAYLKAYWKAHPEKAAEYSARRRSRKRNAGGTFTAADLMAIYAAQGGKCAICRKRITGKPSPDHIIPLALGGSNDRRNIQATHLRCNMTKRDKDPITFMQEIGFLL